MYPLFFFWAPQLTMPFGGSARIEEIKERDAVDALEQIDSLLERLKKAHPERLAAARRRIARTLAAAEG